jgi:hypothetical protein
VLEVDELDRELERAGHPGARLRPDRAARRELAGIAVGADAAEDALRLIRPHPQVAGRDEAERRVAPLREHRLAGLGRDAALGAQEGDRRERDQRLVGLGQRPAVAAVAHHPALEHDGRVALGRPRREQPRAISEALGPHVFPTAEAAVAAAAEEAALAVEWAKQHGLRAHPNSIPATPDGRTVRRTPLPRPVRAARSAQWERRRVETGAAKRPRSRGIAATAAGVRVPRELRHPAVARFA